MRRHRFVTSLGLALFCGLTLALFRTPGVDSRQVAERTVFDATIEVIPPLAQSPCMRLEDGTLTARAVLTDDMPPLPTVLSLVGYQNFVETVGAVLPLGREEASTSLPLKGGLWCWSVEVSPLVNLEKADVGERRAYVQYVAVKMTLAPD